MKKIELNNVSVSYIVGDFSNRGLKDVVIQKLKGQSTEKKFIAVKNVTFAIEEGELLGIVGTNGAGKSTLCKVISGIMRPTEGTMAVRGNIASLLELGTGFDPDLTVKENTFLRGAMLGYTRDFMNKTYGSIIEFAELQGRIVSDIARKIEKNFGDIVSACSKTSSGFRIKFNKELTTRDDAVMTAEIVDNVMLLFIAEYKKK